MEGFHYLHYQSFLLDQAGVICPGTPIEATSPSYFPYYYSSNASQEVSATYESSSSFDSGCMMALGEMCFSSLMAEPQGCQDPPTPQVSLEKKRKNSNETPSSSGQSKVMTKESKSRKQKQPNDEDMKMTNTKKIEKPPAAFIHVRARRGQATDSHSLAERVRREKISERMKMLQDLVPGCEKVTGKALVLDEIINYVQSLQNQVEFLSMKLTSFHPILYDLNGEVYEGCSSQQEKMGSMPEPQPSGIQSSLTQPTAFENATSNYPSMDSSASYLLHEQGPITFSQDNKSFSAQVGDQRQGLLNQFELNSMFSSL